MTAASPKPTASALLPCLDCPRGGKARKEVAAAYVSFLRGERRPKDNRPLPYLPQHCCKQRRADVEAMVA